MHARSKLLCLLVFCCCVTGFEAAKLWKIHAVQMHWWMSAARGQDLYIVYRGGRGRVERQTGVFADRQTDVHEDECSVDEQEKQMSDCNSEDSGQHVASMERFAETNFCSDSCTEQMPSLCLANVIPHSSAYVSVNFVVPIVWNEMFSPLWAVS